MPPEIVVDAVLPPEGQDRTGHGRGEFEHASKVSRIIALWMDELVRIPGTKVRLGLDPIIGLVPGVGGVLSSSVSCIMLIEAVRLGVPLTVLLRMAMNIGINEVLDAVPVVGDAASIFFRSNSRNVEILNRWKAGDQAAAKRHSRLLLGGFLLLWISIMIGWFFFLFLVMSAIWHTLGHLLD